MVRPEYKTVSFNRKLLDMIFGTKPADKSDAGYLLELAAEGIKRKMLRCGTRPPESYITNLLPGEVFALQLAWNDAIDTQCDIPGPCGNKYIFVQVPDNSQWFEAGKTTYLPLPKDLTAQQIQFFDVHAGRLTVHAAFLGQSEGDAGE
jgi:hypothetical protein